MFYKIINDGARSLLTFVNIYNSQDIASYLHELEHEFIQLASYSSSCTDESRCVPSLISALANTEW